MFGREENKRTEEAPAPSIPNWLGARSSSCLRRHLVRLQQVVQVRPAVAGAGEAGAAGHHGLPVCPVRQCPQVHLAVVPAGIRRRVGSLGGAIAGAAATRCRRGRTLLLLPQLLLLLLACLGRQREAQCVSAAGGVCQVSHVQQVDTLGYRLQHLLGRAHAGQQAGRRWRERRHHRLHNLLPQGGRLARAKPCHHIARHPGLGCHRLPAHVSGSGQACRGGEAGEAQRTLRRISGHRLAGGAASPRRSAAAPARAARPAPPQTPLPPPALAPLLLQPGTREARLSSGQLPWSHDRSCGRHRPQACLGVGGSLSLCQSIPQPHHRTIPGTPHTRDRHTHPPTQKASTPRAPPAIAGHVI